MLTKSEARIRPNLTSSPTLRGIRCQLLGHNPARGVARVGSPYLMTCACGLGILSQDGSQTRIRHVLSCFFGHHSYVRITERNGHNEYACIRCGHPLLFVKAEDPYASSVSFEKKVRYLCNLFGHRVHTVTTRSGFTEYACSCGHNFLKERCGLRKVRHPLICFFAGHFVRSLAAQPGKTEYVCCNCGHTFLFTADPTRGF